MTNDNNHYIADEGKTFVRLIDGKIMGNDLYLGLFVDGTGRTFFIEYEGRHNAVLGRRKPRTPRRNGGNEQWINRTTTEKRCRRKKERDKIPLFS